MKDDYQDRFLFSCWRTCFGSLLLLGAVLPGWSQTNLAERVLVVYNASVPESIAVANYYLTQRGIPAENKCAITPTDPTAIEWNEFDSTVKTPLRACVDALGKERILYIVFAYQTPFRLLNVPTESGLEMRALDQFAADLWNDQVADVTTITSHPYFATAQSQGNVYAPFVSLSDFRKQLNATQLYSVWRLDAATAELARGLVDKAMQTEANGLRGQGVFDRRFGPAAGLEDWNYGAGDWDLQRAADATRRAGLPVTEDEQEPEFGTAPAPLFCDQVALYAGWYSYNNYNDAFEWAPGAIGLHLDSASAADPRGGANWAANALQHGITVTSGAVNEPYLEGLAHPDGVFRDLFAGANVGDALLRNTAFLQWMVINIGDPLYRPFPGGLSPFNAATVAQNSLALDSPFLVGGKTIHGTVTLSAPAPDGGVEIPLSNSRTWAATIPASVFVPAGETQTTFDITTEVTTYYQAAILTATFPEETIANTLAIAPLLSALTFAPPVVTGEMATTGTIFLNDAAPSDGVVVTLSSDNPAVATVPDSITIAEGQTKVGFKITPRAVTQNTSLTITATLSGSQQAATLLVVP